MSNDDNPPRRTGSPWALPSNNGPRIGRVGSSGGRRIATLGDIGGGGPSLGGGGHGGPSGHGHGHGDDDEEDEEEDAPGERGGENWYAGGERSGISVQNPDRGGAPGGDLVRDLLRRAQEAGPPTPPTGGGRPPRSYAFFGGGHTLGSDEVDSTFVPDPNAAPPQQEGETAVRHLTFWREGFTVEDGELMRYDDPANEQILAEINSGRAPPQILNVQPGQPVELCVVKRLDEAYVPSARAQQAKTFSGQGHRLGSPVPGIVGAGESSGAVPGDFPVASGSGGGSMAASISTRFEVDQTKPTTNIQIRLADGSRMVARMNLTHTVGDIRNYINASRPENHARAYAIMTTFPNKTLEDDNQTIEAAKLANSVIVQRWE
ncbi:uncharacterized protein BXZ73DRAFT_89178 [Epithele typhae]|uniref:uncharacterized protein n=1 Tax=Epithele typhae TaxID=378194 RepID=UPI002007C8A5|nr:uncharacterized protein BXZ73DRAFT_89178 [Epithele typhae]KAH9938800.1 hypothetical protein BXZ73DRAFT_89178 [Epithele typhae]